MTPILQNLFLINVQMGTAADKLSSSATSTVELESIKVEEPLHEYVRLLSSVKTAMQRRQDKKTLYTDALVDLEAKQASYNKVVGNVGKESQIQEKLNAVEKSQSSVDNAKIEFEDVSEKLLEEFERFKREKTVDIREILLEYVNMQVLL